MRTWVSLAASSVLLLLPTSRAPLARPAKVSPRARQQAARHASSGGAAHTRPARRPPPGRMVLAPVVLRAGPTQPSGPGKVGPRKTRPGARGAYSGVTPGLPALPPLHLSARARARCTLTWTGFQLLPNGSRVFLQSTQRVATTQASTAGLWTIRLPGCRVLTYNALRPLDTRFFDTPILSVRLRKRRRRPAALRVRLRRPATPRIRWVRMQGVYYLFVTFVHPHRTFVHAHRTFVHPHRRGMVY